MLWLTVAALAAVVVGWLSYLSAIPRGKVKQKPIGHLSVEVAGVLVAVGSVAWSYHAAQPPGAAAVTASTAATVLGLFFVYLYSQRKVPKGDIQVRVGEPLLTFEAMDSYGQPFSTESLRGKRVLLKFFRGGW